uniref:Squalene monooxygenase n=1 Tax=Ananas comosus var. bracteatus TaxID=296719 RepID=A0A6V7Q2A4_ANACO|nr:unnamed protein product [Ananas comosus var. bracteatus]
MAWSDEETFYTPQRSAESAYSDSPMQQPYLAAVVSKAQRERSAEAEEAENPTPSIYVYTYFPFARRGRKVEEKRLRFRERERERGRGRGRGRASRFFCGGRDGGGSPPLRSDRRGDRRVPLPPRRIPSEKAAEHGSGRRISAAAAEVAGKWESGAEVAGDGGAADVIVVGAGVAGSALAYTLGKDGRRVHVIERDLSEPDRIVGELLQPGGYLKLIELGLEDCVKEIDAQRVLGYALFKDGKNAKVSYPLEKFHSDVAGRSFHNGRFIQRMREKAASLPNVRLEQGTVTSLLEENGTVKGVLYKTKSGEEFKAYAPLTVVCDGCFSNLRRSLCSPRVDVPSCFVGLVLENCNLPYPNHGHVILADPSPILFYPISSTEIRCLVDVPGQKVPSIANGEMANYLKTVVAPQIPPELYDAFIAAIDKGNIRTMPNRSMPAALIPLPELS